MAKPPSGVKAAVKRLENPYAWTQIDGFHDDEDLQSSVRDANRLAPEARPVVPGADLSKGSAQSDLFAVLPEQPRKEQPSGNPYRSLADLEDDEPEVAAIPQGKATASSAEGTATQAEFVRWFRRFFSQYMPALERDRLKPEYRDFIERNKGRSPKSRFRLIQAMQRYDLSGLALSPQFNRESEAETAQKLRDIEKSIGEDG